MAPSAARRTTARPGGRGREDRQRPGEALSARPSPSVSSASRLRCCDVYVGFHGRKPSLLRFASWLRAELELQGISCFACDRARCRSSRSHETVERAMDASSFGVVILTRKSFANPYTIEELRHFYGRKNLCPIFFDLGAGDCLTRDIVERRGELWDRHGGELWVHYDGWRRSGGSGRRALPRAGLAAGGLRGELEGVRVERGGPVSYEAGEERRGGEGEQVEGEGGEGGVSFPSERRFRRPKEGALGAGAHLVRRRQWRRGAGVLRAQDQAQEEEPAGRPCEAPPSCGGEQREGPAIGRQQQGERAGSLEGVREGDRDAEGGEPAEAAQTASIEERSRLRPRKRSTKMLYGKGIACVSGDSGIGKTELVLEYAYRFSQRYKMVLWVGGEARYIRQNYLNLRNFLELDLGIENHSVEKGKTTRCFEEQEKDSIARVRKELMRDIPFLVVIDNWRARRTGGTERTSWTSSLASAEIPTS
ncbi:uncharacterized protein M6B38_314130 [Iris pallida]|uniref:TIR domain-containing protein n=1 Tax=Iris pallida TaxID=29817 RepID=A0AAX6HF64_IRIPA|nr:uncharacterized protein M6B38_314130 [Iris pallida]